MEIKKEKKLIEELVTIYVATDGEEFDTERDCWKHEWRLKRKSVIAKAELLRIKDLDGKYPIDDNALPCVDNLFTWYKVDTIDDFKALDNAYDNKIEAPEVYPEIICVETAGNEEYEGDVYTYHLSVMKASTEWFWSRLGYKVTLEKEKRL